MRTYRTYDQPTEAEQNILDYIKTYIGEHGYPPSMREIRDNTRAGSTSVVRFYLQQLERCGLVQLTPAIARGIRVL